MILGFLKPSELLRKLPLLATPALMAALLMGCRTPEALTDPIVGPNFRISNVHSPAPIPPSIRRIAALPIAADLTDLSAGAGKKTMAPLVLEELAKSRQFDVVTIDAQTLRDWTGRDSLGAEDVLPKGFLTKVREHAGADAIAFIRLTHYRPYPPMSIGWKIRIVDSASGDSIWALDEVFDTADPTVVNSARRYQRQQSQPAPALEDSRSILYSPMKFGRFTLHEAFETLPRRSL